jgi:hypothetical protein
MLKPWPPGPEERHPTPRVEEAMLSKNYGKLIRKITVQLETLVMAP